MVKHNNVVPNQHFHKKWQTSSRGPLHIKSWFNQPGKKKSRRLKRAAKAAAKTLRAAEKERSVSEEMLRERIADLESELESSGVAAEEEIARLKTESAEIAAKLEETERRARDAEESYADALRVAAEEKEACEEAVQRMIEALEEKEAYEADAASAWAALPFAKAAVEGDETLARIVVQRLDASSTAVVLQVQIRHDVS